MSATLPEYLDEGIRSSLAPALDTVREYIPGPFRDVFLSTPPTSHPGGHRSISLWVFTDLHVVAIWNPSDTTRRQFDVSYLADCVDWLRFDARRFAGNKPESQSSLLVEYTTADGVSGELWGEGEKSCAHLLEIYKDRFLKNFYPPEDIVSPEVRQKRNAGQSAPQPE